MAKQVVACRDIEASAIYKDQGVTFKFEWTIENFNYAVLRGCTSPKIELPGATLSLFLKCNSDRIPYCIRLSINSSFPLQIMGEIITNDQVYNINRSLISGGNDYIWSFSKCEIASVCTSKFLFDMKVYGIKTEYLTFTKKNKNGTKIIEDYRQHWQNNIQHLWHDPKFSDFQIQVGKDSLPVHKNILSAGSPVFARMFQNPTIEVTQNVVSVTDVAPDTLKLLIGFMYGHFPDINGIKDVDKLCELYYASDKYEVLFLRDACGGALVERMTVQNVHQLIDLFDRHSDSELTKQVVNFCCMYFKDIVKTNEGGNMVLKKANFFSLVLEKIAEQP